MVNNSTNIKKTTTSYLKSLKTRIGMTCGFGNPGSGLGRARKCVWVKPVNGIPTLSILIIESQVIPVWIQTFILMIINYNYYSLICKTE